MQRKRWLLLLAAVLAFALAFGGPVSAYQDLDRVPGSDKIEELRTMGIIDGIGRDLFGPNQKLSFAEGITAIVRGMRLNIDHIKFIKEPKASDYFTRVPDNAWYAKSFIIAHLNGLDLPKDINPKQHMTREEFAHYLFQGLIRTGDYAFIELFVMINDEKQINPDYMESIQKLLVSKIAELDDKGNFYPKRQITRAEAAVMLYNAVRFIKEMQEIPNPPVEDDVTMNVEKVNDDIVKVTLTRGEKPNSGYTLEITKIEFQGTNAVIYYRTGDPLPDHMYPQVITEPTAVAYLPASYEATIERDSESAAGAGLSDSVSSSDLP